jgi:NADH-quinone oxidoreductase subunit N
LLIFLLSLAGIPPTAGFVGKFYVFGAAVQAQMWVLVAVAAVNSVIAAFYYLNVVRYMFLVPADESAGPIRISPPLGGALAATGLLTLLLGVLPGPLIAWASASADTLLVSLR